MARMARRCLWLAPILQLVAAVPNPEEFVNIRGGTESRFGYSIGNTLVHAASANENVHHYYFTLLQPLMGRPWGFNHWSVQSDDSEGSWYFHPSDKRLFGIRLGPDPPAGTHHA